MAVSVKAPRATMEPRAAIKNTPGSITYNEWSGSRKAQKLNVARIVTFGRFPDPVSIKPPISVGKTESPGAKDKGTGQTT